GLHHVRAGARLLAHGIHRAGGRPDEGDARGFARAHEGRVLREKTVAGVDRVGPRLSGNVEDGLLVQVALARRRRADAVRLISDANVTRGAIGLRVDGNGLKAVLAAGAHDADGDLSAVGDEDFLEAGHVGRARYSQGYGSRHDHEHGFGDGFPFAAGAPRGRAARG